MTANGADTADPVEGRPFPTGLTFRAGQTADDIRAQQAAYDKCKRLLPATWPVKLDPKEVARSRGYFQCMRKHGVPEPVPDRNGLINEPTEDKLGRMPGYDAAVRACRHLVDDPANNDPANK
jgi:hypothetical protein